MRFLLAAGALVGAFASAMAQSQDVRTVWDGVYTEEQAARGRTIYTAQCSRCHGDTLLGGEAPALTGPLFTANWDGAPLVDLFDRIRSTMPSDSPGTLSRRDTAEVIAYLLKVGRFPVSGVSLGTDSESLRQITFVAISPEPKEDRR